MKIANDMIQSKYLLKKGDGRLKPHILLNKRYHCLYTNQITKKRKTWSDGYLKVNLTESGKFCTLTTQSNIVLESKQLETNESEAIFAKQSIELVFENYLVQLEDYGDHNCDTQSIEKVFQPPLKLTKFVPPSRFVPPINQSVDLPGVNTNHVQSSNSFSQGSRAISSSYNITDEELDSLWGNNSSRKQCFSEIKPRINNQVERIVPKNSPPKNNLESISKAKEIFDDKYISNFSNISSTQMKDSKFKENEKISLDIDQSIWFS